jgi:hypothetical protein
MAIQRSSTRVPTRKWSIAVGAGAALIWPALAQAASLNQDAASSPSQWPLLLALLATAFVIERLLELFWSYLEALIVRFGRQRPVALESTSYVKFKTGTSVLLAAILGILLAGLFQMQLLAALQPLALGFIGAVPVNWDAVITGLVIGLTAVPIHEIIGFLGAFRRFFASAALHQREEAGAALATGVLRLAESETQSMVEVPGMGLTQIAPGGVGSEDSKAAEVSPTDRYIQIIRSRTST